MFDFLWPRSCAACGEPGSDRVCRVCRGFSIARVRPPPGIDAAWTLAPYDSPLGVALRRAKVDGDLGLAWVLGELLRRRAGDLSHWDVLVPAPSTWRTLARRGFSASSVLAWRLACGGPPVANALVRPRGRRQAALDRAGRVANLEHGLRARRRCPPRVLLIDDVMATGSTLTACAAAVRGAGAGEVGSVTLCTARIVPPLNWRPR